MSDRRPGIFGPATPGERIVRWAAIGAIALAANTALNLRFLRRPSSDAPEVTEKVSALVPARNEERHIERTVRSLLDQQGIVDLEVIVLDDGSTDATADILRTFDDPRLIVITGINEPPPDGWLGKPWACARLADEATGRVLVFADADVAFVPNAVRSAVDVLRSGRFALISPFPEEVAETPAERLIQPLLTWSWLATLPFLRWSESSRFTSLTAANGQFLVFDSDAYRAIGGHHAVRGNVLDDMGMMRAIKAARFRAAPIDGSQLASCRMYETPEQLVDGYTKSLWSAFGGPVGSVLANGVLAGLYVVPALAALLGTSGRMRTWGAIGYAAGVTGRAMVARSVQSRAWPDSLAHPLSVLAFHGLNVLSWWRHYHGVNTWKGRSVTLRPPDRRP